MNTGASPHGREHGPDKSVNMEQGHDVESPVIGRKSEAPGNVRGRGGEIVPRQGHDLGSRRGSRGVQDECCSGIMGDRATARFLAQAQREGTGPRVLRDTNFGQSHAQIAGHGDGVGSGPLLDNQQPGIEILEIEPELVPAIGRIEWCGGEA